MKQLTQSDLMSLEEYAKCRDEYRAEAMEYRGLRRVHLGEHVTIHFENRKTLQYQIQEMLRAEKIFDQEGIEEELAAYNPMVPSGKNLMATMMIEYIDVEERKVALTKLLGIEDKVWIQVADHEKVYPIADEELERDNEEKTSAVHVLRFEFTDDMISDAVSGAHLSMGVEHELYTEALMPMDSERRDVLVADFD